MALYGLLSISDLLKPGFFYAVAAGFAVLIVVLLILIYWNLYKRKQAFFRPESFRMGFELWVSKLVLEDTQIPASRIPAKFAKHLKQRDKRQFALNSLIELKKSVAGTVGDKVVALYLELGFKADSIEKLDSPVWYKKVKGINELSVMKQEDMNARIFKLTNNRNKYIRREAQAAMFNFYGFRGLRFLNVLTHSLSDWQQLNLIEQLRPLDPEPIPGLSNWLYSDNNTVVVFALKLAEIYQCFEVHDEVVSCLTHEREEVRGQAAKTLKEIAGDATAAILCERYASETPRNKIVILNSLTAIAGDAQQPFLMKELDSGNDFLKLGAARVIVTCCTAGWGLLESKAAQQPLPFRNIYNHLRFELKR
ncbi:HEAT repeat domain-containing protein [Niabella drilacis]|uniref:HEAT repeat-containing protein n=1 Tax=Niabella drilacis (strain DSM 25811 / CCM 8410 / CCUG 62505 / LMG 26954 / E90) TaxID=1285928 RepID=A0A1G6Z1S1_NIADE|nr:hypothetical protein [Niabella drilacis]SDD96548.1 hypothetical protein SAMN04487894_11723 [Niabella drilacis]